MIIELKSQDDLNRPDFWLILRYFKCIMVIADTAASAGCCYTSSPTTPPTETRTRINYSKPSWVAAVEQRV